MARHSKEGECIFVRIVLYVLFFHMADLVHDLLSCLCGSVYPGKGAECIIRACAMCDSRYENILYCYVV